MSSHFDYRSSGRWPVVGAQCTRDSPERTEHRCVSWVCTAHCPPTTAPSPASITMAHGPPREQLDQDQACDESADVSGKSYSAGLMSRGAGCGRCLDELNNKPVAEEYPRRNPP